MLPGMDGSRTPLTSLVSGLRLFDIKCASFNDPKYGKFFPRSLFVQPRYLMS